MNRYKDKPCKMSNRFYIQHLLFFFFQRKDICRNIYSDKQIILDNTTINDSACPKNLTSDIALTICIHFQ
jgi:hypothetical protein